MSYLNISSDSLDEGLIPLQAGIHRNIRLKSIQFIENNDGSESIAYTFISPASGNKAEESYVFRHKWGSTEQKKLEFAAKVTNHIIKNALDLKVRCEELESVLGLEDPIVNTYTGFVEYKATINNVTSNYDTSLIILNTFNSIRQLVELLNIILRNHPEHTFSVKLCQLAYNGKVSVGFNLISMPFLDDVSAKRLRFNPEIDNQKATTAPAPNFSGGSSFSPPPVNSYHADPF